MRGLVLVTLMLAFVGQVQAGIDGLPEPVQDVLPEVDPDGAIAAVEAIAEQTQDRAANTAAEAEGRVWTLKSDLDDLVQPVHDQIHSVRQQVDDLVAPSEAPEDAPAQPEAAPATQATVQVDKSLYGPVLLLTTGAAGLGALLWFLGQTATVGAGAAGTAAANDGRRFLPYASPLFTRFEKDTVLGHPKREALYGSIVGKPGVTLQDLCEESGLSRTAVTHHLRLLEQQHLIVSKRVGRSRHFFENGGRYGRDQKEAYAVLHNDRTKEIADYIKEHPGAIQKDLCSKFDIQASVAHWHVKRLLDAKLVESIREGRTVSYFPSADVAAPAYA